MFVAAVENYQEGVMKIIKMIAWLFSHHRCIKSGIWYVYVDSGMILSETFLEALIQLLQGRFFSLIGFADFIALAFLSVLAAKMQMWLQLLKL